VLVVVSIRALGRAVVFILGTFGFRVTPTVLWNSFKSEFPSFSFPWSRSHPHKEAEFVRLVPGKLVSKGPVVP
jgi:hypothetical protein